MNCFRCPGYIRENRSVCKDILDLLSELDIPLQEQPILWNMANKNMTCKRFRDILFAMKKTQEKDNSLLQGRSF